MRGSSDRWLEFSAQTIDGIGRVGAHTFRTSTRAMRVLMMALALVLVATGAVPVLARPDVVPPEPVDFTEAFATGFPCEFSVEAVVTGNGGAVLFDDRAIWTSPGLTVDLTNLELQKTVSYVIAGVLHDTFLGDVVRTKLTGRNILLGIIDGQPGMFLTVGKIVVESPSDDLFTIGVVEEDSPGSMIDVCAQLG